MKMKWRRKKKEKQMAMASKKWPFAHALLLAAAHATRSCARAQRHARASHSFAPHAAMAAALPALLLRRQRAAARIARFALAQALRARGAASAWRAKKVWRERMKYPAMKVINQ
jgi:hypothetical protein